MSELNILAIKKTNHLLTLTVPLYSRQWSHSKQYTSPIAKNKYKLLGFRFIQKLERRHCTCVGVLVYCQKLTETRFCSHIHEMSCTLTNVSLWHTSLCDSAVSYSQLRGNRARSAELKNACQVYFCLLLVSAGVMVPLWMDFHALLWADPLPCPLYNGKDLDKIKTKKQLLENS